MILQEVRDDSLVSSSSVSICCGINKNGIQGLDEVVNQGVIKWNF